jgi:hypothetical protein
MVRPLVDEERLQSLEELEVDQLRPEFVEQVMSLRRKVLNKLPIKRVVGHSLNGATWINMLEQYCEAFNNGNVPNIESSWHNICQ